MRLCVRVFVCVCERVFVCAFLFWGDLSWRVFVCVSVSVFGCMSGKAVWSCLCVVSCCEHVSVDCFLGVDFCFSFSSEWFRRGVSIVVNCEYKQARSNDGSRSKTSKHIRADKFAGPNAHQTRYVQIDARWYEALIRYIFVF